MIRSTPIPYLGILLTILIIKATAITFLIVQSGIGLSPDEAQYWTWSQALDWGYYSKPPGIAWQIFLGTSLFGNTVLGVRALSIVAGVFTPLLIYLLARKCRLSIQAAFCSALILALSPLGVISSMLAITDIGMIFFWTCSLIVITGALSQDKPPNYYFLGTFVALGALFKWPIYLIWLLILLGLPLFSSLKSKHIVGGVGISLIGLLPSFTWNIQNNWATFRHVTSSIQGSPQATAHVAGNPLEFIGSQVALISPVLFILLILAIIAGFRCRNELPQGIKFLLYTTTLLFGVILALSFFKKVQGNWCDYAYPSAIVLIGWYSCNRIESGSKWVAAGLCLSLALCTVLFSVPYVQSHNLLPKIQVPYKSNPFKHNLGWENLPEAIEKSGYDKTKDFLFSSKYQMSSILSFYSPGQNRAYFLNIFGIRNNQFSYWPSMRDEQIGKDGYYIIAENQPHLDHHIAVIDDYIEKLRPYFDKVEYLGVTPLFTSYDQTAKAALVFKGHKYNGNEPSQNRALY